VAPAWRHLARRTIRQLKKTSPLATSSSQNVKLAGLTEARPARFQRFLWCAMRDLSPRPPARHGRLVRP